MIPLLEIKHLKKYFNTPKGRLHAVDDINLSIEQGKTLGIVGESGCGKSTLGRTVLRLIEPTSGEIVFNGTSILSYSKKQFKPLRKDLQMIFQDPYTSLNPRLSVSDLIAEPLIVNKAFTSKRDMEEKVIALMKIVGLAERLKNSFPHELDGGRRQRIGIARALATNPKFIVCDEPVSALDVSIQAQILNLLMDLQEERKLSYMFITHDLSVVKHISEHIAVMYLGQCVEYALTEELFKHPIHPYTKALLNATPSINYTKERKQREVIYGEVTSPIEPAKGCRFAPRCPFKISNCIGEDLRFVDCGNGHFVSCARFKEFC